MKLICFQKRFSYIQKKKKKKCFQKDFSSKKSMFSVMGLLCVRLDFSSCTVRDLDKRMSLKKEIRVPFRAPLFFSKWYGIAT